MRKLKKINGYLVVKFNDRERRENPSLGAYGVIDAELYTGDLDLDRSEMEYDDAETLEVAVEQARGLDAEEDFTDEPPRYTVVVEDDHTLTEEDVEPQLLIKGWETQLETQIKSDHYKDVDPRTAAHELYGYKVALNHLGLLGRDETAVDLDHFAPGMVDGPLPKNSEELLAYICDKVCKHRDECIGQDELAAACAKCSLERLVSEADDRDLRIKDVAKKRLDELIRELAETSLNTKAKRLELEAQAYLEAITTTKALSKRELMVYESALSEAIKMRPGPPRRKTFENLEPETKNSLTTRSVYALGELLEDECPQNDCRIYLNVFRMTKETDAALDELDASGHAAQVLRHDLHRGLSELRRMYSENYAIREYRKGAKA